jgi:2-polyprenyl-3-methyl-5-hydroxy-6-metoxy-1,4-benzoquinol methylase
LAGSGNRGQGTGDIHILEAIPNLAEHLCEYDLLITHYGLTAFEALYVGVPVILVNPTPYHEKLAKNARFITVKKPSSSSLVPLCLRVNSLRIICEKLAVKYGLDKPSESLPSFVNHVSPQVNKKCPVCGEKKPQKSLARFNDRTHRRCPRCGIIHMDRIFPAPVEYEKEYFFEFYKKQYGKTYIEDFPNLTVMAKRRLKIIKRIGGKDALLDIGCAYGPFLAAAREEGFSPSGMDPARDAVNYVHNELGIPAVQGFFPDCPPPAAQYDVVTLWYVIEHFRDCVPVLKEIRKILKPGGILAFSTPSFAGVSGRTSLNKFLSKSPGDHFTVWSPKTCKKALALAGFKVKKIVISGHHPERFPLFGKFAKSKMSPFYWLLLAVSKIFGLGDTFEAYAVH